MLPSLTNKMKDGIFVSLFFIYWIDWPQFLELLVKIKRKYSGADTLNMNLSKR